jgi:hypothetical protein
MGLVTKSAKPDLKRMPSGSFTVDAEGGVVSSTLPQSVPAELVGEIGRHVVSIFRGAREAQVGFSELVVQYAAFKITAREMRGGAIIFLSPRAAQVVSRSQ